MWQVPRVHVCRKQDCVPVQGRCVRDRVPTSNLSISCMGLSPMQGTTTSKAWAGRSHTHSTIFMPALTARVIGLVDLGLQACDKCNLNPPIAGLTTCSPLFVNQTPMRDVLAHAGLVLLHLQLSMQAPTGSSVKVSLSSLAPEVMDGNGWQRRNVNHAQR
jgi:hypothetical protein